MYLMRCFRNSFIFNTKITKILLRYKHRKDSFLDIVYKTHVSDMKSRFR